MQYAILYCAAHFFNHCQSVGLAVYIMNHGHIRCVSRGIRLYIVEPMVRAQSIMFRSIYKCADSRSLRALTIFTIPAVLHRVNLPARLSKCQA